MPETSHHRIEFPRTISLGGELHQPFTESGIQRSPSRTCDFARFLDQLFVCAESDVLHTSPVYTSLV